jgi:hypothetical protein
VCIHFSESQAKDAKLSAGKQGGDDSVSYKRTLLVAASLIVPILLVLTLFVTAGGLSARAIEADKGSSAPATYLGSNVCKGCHGPGNAFGLPDTHTSWRTTAHGQMVNPVTFGSGGTVVGDLAELKAQYGVTWSQEIAMLESGNADSAKVLGIGINVQEFIVLSGTDWLVLPIEWLRAADPEEDPNGEWEAPVTHTDPSTWTKWLDSCAACHTTGFNYPARTYAEEDIACEACHGPGSEHPAVAFTNPPGQRNIYAKPDAQVCGQCHIRSKSGSPTDFPVGYMPGLTLTDYITPSAFSEVDRWWQTPGQYHAKMAYTQWIEWGQTRHATALTEASRDSCLQCHSADYRLRATLGYTPTLATVQFSITCEACHDPHTPGPRGTGKGQLREVDNAFVEGLCSRCHDAGDPALHPESSLAAEEQLLCADCHTSGSPINPLQRPGEVHHPMVETFTGVTTATFGLDQPMPAPMHTAGVTCANCHMPGTGTEGLRPISTHSWMPITPGLSITGPAAGIPNACTNSGCHSGAEGKGFAMTDQEAQELIDSRQAEIKTEAEELTVELDAQIGISDTAPYKQAWTALSLVESEGSWGIHNYIYEKTILAKAFEALGVAQGKPGYVGSDVCQGCHLDKYNGWQETLHPRMTQEPKPENIKANFSLTNTISISDVVYVLGWKYRQRFVVSEGDDLVVAPVQWNIAQEEWVAAPEESWTQNCIGCHTTGYDPATKTWKDLGISCEACHGPAQEHVAGGFANPPGQRGVYAQPDQQICGACHNQGTDPNGAPWPLDYTPGMTLTFTSVPLTDTMWWWQDPHFHAKEYRQQYPEWLRTGHGRALEPAQMPFFQDQCLECHSIDYRLAVEAGQTPPTKATVKYPVNCIACHETHDKGRADNQLRAAEGEWINNFCQRCHTASGPGGELPPDTESGPVAELRLCGQCHNGEDFTTDEGRGGVHNPMLEVFTGAVTETLGITQAMPSHMHQAGVTCANCHYVPTGKSASQEDVASHVTSPVTPGLSITGTAAGIPNSCTNSGCHSGAPGKGFPMSNDHAQQIIDERQADIRAKLAALDARLQALPSAAQEMSLYKEADTAWAVVQQEGSFGIHNYQYDLELLRVANQKVDRIHVVLLPVVVRGATK